MRNQFPVFAEYSLFPIKVEKIVRSKKSSCYFSISGSSKPVQFDALSRTISKARCGSTKSGRCCARDTINISDRIIGRLRSMPDLRTSRGPNCLSS